MAGGDVTVSEASVIKADVPIGGEGPAFQDIMPLATAHNSGIGDVATSEKMDIEDESVHIGSGNIHVAISFNISGSIFKAIFPGSDDPLWKMLCNIQ